MVCYHRHRRDFSGFNVKTNATELHIRPTLMPQLPISDGVKIITYSNDIAIAGQALLIFKVEDLLEVAAEIVTD